MVGNKGTPLYSGTFGVEMTSGRVSLPSSWGGSGEVGKSTDAGGNGLLGRDASVSVGGGGSGDAEL